MKNIKLQFAYPQHQYRPNGYVQSTLDDKRVELLLYRLQKIDDVLIADFSNADLRDVINFVNLYIITDQEVVGMMKDV